MEEYEELWIEEITTPWMAFDRVRVGVVIGGEPGQGGFVGCLAWGQEVRAVLIKFVNEDMACEFRRSLKTGAVLRMEEDEQEEAAFGDASGVLAKYGLEYLLMASDHFAWALGFRTNPKKLKTFLAIAEVDPKIVKLQLA